MHVLYNSLFGHFEHQNYTLGLICLILQVFYTFCGCGFFFIYFLSNLFKFEKICLKKLKTVMLSGTYCIHVDSGHERQCFPWCIVCLPTEWREKLERVKRLHTATEFLMINVKSFSGVKLFIPLWRRTSGKTGNNSMWFLVFVVVVVPVVIVCFFLHWYFSQMFLHCLFSADDNFFSSESQEV